MFLDLGYSPEFFWSLSIGEVDDLIQSHTRRREREAAIRKSEMKDLIVILENHAEQSSRYFARCMGAEIPIRSLKEYYPDLFNYQEAPEEEHDRVEIELMVHKAKMEEYAYRHNLALEKRGETIGRNDS